MPLTPVLFEGQLYSVFPDNEIAAQTEVAPCLRPTAGKRQAQAVWLQIPRFPTCPPATSPQRTPQLGHRTMPGTQRGLGTL